MQPSTAVPAPVSLGFSLLRRAPCRAPPPLPSLDSTREGILMAGRALGVSLASTARLAIHIWDRIHGMVRLVISVRLPIDGGCDADDGNRPPSAAAAAALERVYAMATLWLAAKLEEPRNELPGVRTMATLCGTLPGCVAEAELRVLRWCEWAPRAGFSALAI
ncbi:hypothetical protein GPECTOR_41g718 [Gonium pectorale]|uniref:Cyclin N-terminal domain-containing protein n=1 Tax=Gonium pectorale TaxID=33097 RepID=A0A150GAF7_GONPE|nr:hypothetical protein GPECTOR_41g718 [Gonium pectorale]|eukprot:KXZ46753.1 hypothetical protein GPECTOR_41g718 [Gonium pectorale]